MKKHTTEMMMDQSMNGLTLGLDEVVRQGAQRMLAAALSHEADEYVGRFTGLTDPKGHRMVVRNGSLPERELVTGAGPESMTSGVSAT